MYNAGYCGDSVCDFAVGEDSFSCFEDCGEGQLRDYGCREIVDPVTGFTEFECETETYECFGEPPEVKETCLAYGGTPVSEKDPFGCDITFCKFDGVADKDQVFFGGECLPGEKAKEVLRACEKNGLTGILDVGLNGCFFPRCEGKQNNYEDVCETYSTDEISELENACKAQGGTLVPKFDDNGCKTPSCESGDVCIEIENNAVEKCAAFGGSMVVEKDDAGCVVYANCIKRGETSIESEEVNEVPEQEKLIELSDRLDELSLDIGNLVTRSEELAAFYEEKNDEASQTKFETLVAMLEAANTKIGMIQKELEENIYSITTDDLENLKIEVKYVRDVLLQDAMFLLLSEPLGDEVVDCGTNDSCFMQAFRICQKATISHVEAGTTFEGEILGLQNERCVFEIRIELEGQQLEMTCRDPNYALGDLGDGEFLNYCEGSLLERISEFTSPEEVE